LEAFIGYEEKYLVSNFGEIYSKSIGKKIKFNTTKDGYYSIKLRNNDRNIHTSYGA